MKSSIAGKLGLILAAALALGYAHSATPHRAAKDVPTIVFWAWDQPEDMRPLAGKHAVVAYLAATMLLDQSLHVSPRLQPVALAPDTSLVAVIRVETRRGFHEAPQLRRALTAAILDVGARSGVHAIQIDFDATRSERDFYRDVLGEIRAGLPQRTALSITALLSWCAHDDWIRGLPIDGAIPMYFRLGREAHNVFNGDSTYAIREPLCADSAGVATDEPSRNLTLAGKRVYIFNPRPWTARQLRLLAERERP